MTRLYKDDICNCTFSQEGQIEEEEDSEDDDHGW